MEVYIKTGKRKKCVYTIIHKYNKKLYGVQSGRKRKLCMLKVRSFEQNNQILHGSSRGSNVNGTGQLLEKGVYMRQNKKKMSVTVKIFIALVLGAICGMGLYYLVPAGTFRDTILINGILNVIGNGFLRAMQMLVVPLVLCSLICGSMSIGDTKSMGKIGIRTIAFYMITTAIAITLSLGIGKLVNPGKGLNIASIHQTEVTIAQQSSLSDVLINIIPKNPIASLAEGNMLQIIVFAILIGIILAKFGEKAATVANFFRQMNDIMMEMTAMVMKVAPIGVFCLITKTFAGIGFDVLLPLLKYIGGVYIALAIQCFIVYLLLLKGVTKLDPRIFIRKFLPVMGFAYSTASSNATIPYSIETLEKKHGVSKRISSFTIPLGATVNMDGTAIMQGVAVIFAAQAFGIELTFANYLTVILTATLASIGTAGVPGVGIITLSMVFSSVGLPIEAISLIMGVDRIVDMARTVVNITGDAVCTTIVAHMEQEVDYEVYAKEDSARKLKGMTVSE